MASSMDIVETVTSFLDSSSSSSGDAEELLNSSSSSSCWSSSDSDDGSETREDSFLFRIRDFSEQQFKQHFRLTRGCVDTLIEKYKAAQVAPKGEKGGRQLIGEDVEIYIFLWYMANTETIRQIGNLFSISKSATWVVVKRVSSWLVSINNDYIRWPTRSECATISTKFQSMKGIPGIIGAIDGTHIKIKAPTENKGAYYNRKKYFSLATQAIVDANKRFIDVHCGEPGSLHDSRILRRSCIFRAATTNKEALFPEQTFLLGDSAYPVLDWLVPPYKDNGTLTDVKHRFNTLHSSTRMVVENAFGLLKARFRRIQFFTEHVDLTLCTNIIISAFILHNICIDSNLEIEDNLLNDDNIGIEENDVNDNADDTSIFPRSNTSRREALLRTLAELGIL